MAEILGVVSGGVGIVSLAAQLLSSAQALRSFVANARNAPDRLKSLAYDIETFAVMLEEFEFDPRDDREPINALLDRCIRSVQSQVRIIVRCLERLENIMKQSRVRGRLLAAFEDPEIEKLLDGLERAKTSLLHAHLMYMDLKRTQESAAYQDALVTQLDQILTDRASSQRWLEATADKGYSKISRSLLDTKSRKSRLTKQRFLVALRTRLSRHVCTLIMSHATLFPPVNLKICIQNSISPAFEYCRKGDIIGVRRLLSEGHVGPRDRDKGNFTLLGTAAMAGNIDICLLLINECGLKTDFDEIDNAITVLAINPSHWTGRVVQYQDMFRLLLDKSGIDYEVDEESQQIHAMPHWLLACPDVDTVRLVLQSQEVFNPTTQLFRPDQLLDLDDLQVRRLENPEVLLEIFGIKWLMEELMRLPDAVKQQIVHLAAGKLGHPNFQTIFHWKAMPWSRARWLELVKDIVLAGADPSAVTSGKTPLLFMWSHARMYHEEDLTFRFEEHPMKEMFDRWIETMRNAKVDISDYIQREEQAWTVFKSNHVVDSRGRKESKIPNLCFRPYQVEDLIFESPSGHCSFTFRRERTFAIWQQSQMPGSWEQRAQSSMVGITVTTDGDSPGMGWTKVREVSTLSHAVDVRQAQKRYRSMDVRLSATVERAQDDAGPLALAGLWRRSYFNRSPRTRSQSTPPRILHSQQVNDRWTSTKHSWLPPHHAWPITVFENSPLVKIPRACSCFDFQLSGFHQYKPYWYKVFCLDKSRFGAPLDRQHLRQSIDKWAQEKVRPRFVHSYDH